MRRPSRAIISSLTALFPGFTSAELAQSNNSLPFTFENGSEKYFVKVIDKRMAQQEGLDDIEQRLQGIDCDHIVRLVESGDLNNDYSYLKFEYLDGVNIDEVSKPLSETELKKLACAVTDAIETLWEHGLVHRDIKPQNIMKINGTGDFKLVDLGIGYFAEAPYRDNSRSRSNGSRFYSSPEQFASNQDDRIEITFASDQFSLGVVLFELATGTHPYKGFDEAKYNNYGAAVSLMEPPKVEAFRDDLSPEVAAMINKMVQTEPTDRYTSTKKLKSAANQTELPDAPKELKVYIQDTDDGSGYVRLTNYLNACVAENKPDGVMVTASKANDDRIQYLTNLGFEVIADPLTCKLPYGNASTSNIKGKLGLSKRKVYTASQIPTYMDKIIEGTLEWQKSATSVVLPYFAVRDSNDDYLRFNKEIWRRGRSLIEQPETPPKKVYGGLSIPSDIIVDPKVRKSLASHFLAKYDIDGMFVVFENDKKPIKTLDEKAMLEGIKEILDILYEVGDVIVARSDMAILPLMRGGTFITSFSDSRRRFSFKDQFDSPSPGGGGAIDRKLKYFCGPIYTFLEEKTNLTGLNAAFIAEMACGCIHCEELQPFVSGVAVNHQLAENHFYHNLTDIRNELNLKPSSIEKNTYLREKITTAIDISERLKAETYLRGQEISDHKSLLGLIDY